MHIPSYASSRSLGVPGCSHFQNLWLDTARVNAIVNLLPASCTAETGRGSKDESVNPASRLAECVDEQVPSLPEAGTTAKCPSGRTLQSAAAGSEDSAQ